MGGSSSKRNEMKLIKCVTHVLFDLDGVLIDSEPTYTSIISRIAQKYGKEYTEDVKRKLIGTREADTARIAVTEMELPIKHSEFLKSYRKMQKEELTSPPLHKGVERLICHLHTSKIPFALATSSSLEATHMKTKQYKMLFRKFNHIVAGGSDPEVKLGKPHPDIFLVCASRFFDKPLPEKCLVFEDAPNGVKAASSAGMQVVMIPEVEISEETKNMATMVIKSLEDFNPECFGLPPFSQKCG